MAAPESSTKKEYYIDFVSTSFLSEAIKRFLELSWKRATPVAHLHLKGRSGGFVLENSPSRNEADGKLMRYCRTLS